MEFRLVYEGPLKANGKIAHKHQIRQCFHQQLRKLWNQLPLRDYKHLLSKEVPEGEVSIIEEANGFSFAPLVTNRLLIYAEINILMLRPEEPGSIVLSSGDIDNRLKTLFDALRCPLANGETPPQATPLPEEEPFFCVVKEDSLITSVSVITDRLLLPVDPAHVQLVILVKTKPKRVCAANIGML